MGIQIEGFVLPEGMELARAAELLTALSRRAEAADQTKRFVYEFEGAVNDSLVAISRAIEREFGFAIGMATEGSMFEAGSPPTMLSIPTGIGTAVNVPLGPIQLPGVSGTVTIAQDGSKAMLIADIKQRNEPDINRLVERVQQILMTESIYGGKAMVVDFNVGCDANGNDLPPKLEFIQLAGITADQLILNDSVQAALDASLFGPIVRRADLLANGLPWKRGVLLSGTYGTGKTLTAAITARKAVEAGITFMLCKSARQFSEVMELAAQYSPAVVFCEDIDRVLSGTRGTAMDDFLNTIDGIESKDAEIMVVLTTNDIEAIHPAAMRFSRMDAVVDFGLLDADATKRCIQRYAGESLVDDDSLTDVVAKLVGNTPSMLAEAVKRAKLVAVSRSTSGSIGVKITGIDLLAAWTSMAKQVELINRPARVEPDRLAQAANVIGDYLVVGMDQAIKAVQRYHGPDAVNELAKPSNGKVGLAVPSIEA